MLRPVTSSYAFGHAQSMYQGHKRGLSCGSAIIYIWKEFCILHFKQSAHDKNEASTNHEQFPLDTEWSRTTTTQTTSQSFNIKAN